MSHRDIKKLLKEVKDAPEFGGEFSDVEVTDNWQDVADEIGLDKQATPRSYGISEYFDYIIHTFGTTVLRPVGVTMASLVLVFSGWVTTVDASKDSVPGDMLYPVKLAAERIQLTIAPNEKKTRLRVAFAGRRLREATTLSTDNNAQNNAQVRETVAEFKREMESVSDDLKELEKSNPEEAAQIAAEIDEKTQEYQEIIDESSEDSDEDTKQDVASAEETVQESAATATETLVQNYEQTTSRQTGERLNEKFQDRLKDIDTRITLNLGRLDVIASKLEADNAFSDRIEAARDNLYGHDQTLTDAMDMVARNGYRRAFEMLGGVEEAVDASEETITELEIEISTTDVNEADEETDDSDSDQNNNEDTDNDTDASNEETNADNSNEEDTSEDGADANDETSGATEDDGTNVESSDGS